MRRKAPGKKKTSGCCLPGDKKYSFLENFEGILKLYNTSSGYEIANFTISLSDKETELMQTDSLHLYFKQTSKECFLCWEENDSQKQSKHAWGELNVPTQVLNSLSKNIFHLAWSNEGLCQEKGVVLVKVNITENAFRSLNYAAQPVYYRSGKNMKTVICYFFGIEIKEYDSHVLDDELYPDSLFKYNKNCYDPDKSSNISHEFLIPELRPYQSQAVEWMLNCENVSYFPDQSEIHDLYCELKLPNGTPIFFQKYGGFFVREKYRPIVRTKGGILSDEMGLGKTVEVIACILLNPRNSIIAESQSQDYLNQNPIVESSGAVNCSFECICGSLYSDDMEETIQCSRCGLLQHPDCILSDPLVDWNDYICPYCLVNDKEQIVKSRATLIVSPSVILHQWQEEIERHVEDNCLKVFMYLGVNHHKFIHPSFFADYDIVLTAYEVFKSEINYLNLPHGDNLRALRNPQKYRAIPSPLLSVEWWRVCLDEAQMVENVSAKVSQLAWQLHSINRWCITGTPIQKSFQDLYGLLVFLGYDPFNEKLWWQELLWKPFINGCPDTLIAVLNNVFWRTKKCQVIEQLGIPPIETIVHKLNFSIVEKIFYDNGRTNRVNEFLKFVAEFNCQNDKIDSMDRRLFLKLLAPLKRLQLACDWFGTHQEKRVTIPELHEHLIKTSKLDCEDCHRQLIAALNGVAGINIIQLNFKEAAKSYERALQSIEENKINIKTDKLQQIHTLYNYAKLIEQGHVSVVENSIDSKEALKSNDYDVKCDELVKLYLEKYKPKAQRALESFTACVEKVNDIQSECVFEWWWNLINTLKGEEEEKAFIRNLKNFLSDIVGISLKVPLANKFSDMRGLKFCIVNALEYLLDIREELTKALEKACTPPVSEDFAQCRDCHLRPEKNVKRKRVCQLCEVDSKFKHYESKLFRFDEYREEEEDEQESKKICFQKLRKGTHAESELELTFNFVLNYFKNNAVNDKETERGCKVLELFIALRKEFKAARNSWLAQHYYIDALDEVDMAKTTMRLYIPDVKSKKSEQHDPHLIMPGEIQAKLLQFKSDVITHEKSFKMKLGKLFYLNNLKKADNMDEKALNENCPVCNEALMTAWSVLQCGHSFCCECISVLMGPVVKQGCQLRCPVCREVTDSKDIYYVDPQKMKLKKEESVEVKGRYSTKIAAVIKCLLEIKKNDPTAKSLVFSGFSEIFAIFEEALTGNNIRYICVLDKKTLKERLVEFKTSSDLNVLVLPLQLGANGLNITEASHVLLVEPPMIKSVQLQAIGRLHRFGQDKKITVHEFFIEGTIEENIHLLNATDTSFLNNQGDFSSNSNLTVNDLLSFLGEH